MFIQFCRVSGFLEVFSSLGTDVFGFGGCSAATLLPFLGGRSAASAGRWRICHGRTAATIGEFSGSVLSMLKIEYLFCNDLKVGQVDD